VKPLNRDGLDLGREEVFDCYADVELDPKGLDWAPEGPVPVTIDGKTRNVTVNGCAPGVVAYTCQ
jgi:hypothetical protein